MSESSLGNVLVIGGCGFVGHHVVRALLDDPEAGEVHVLSRRPNTNRFPAAHYHAGDISSSEDVKQCLAATQPRVIIHTASPDYCDDPPNPSAYYKINVEGTDNLLACAKESSSVAAFVYTSSTTVYKYDANGECRLMLEDGPMYGEPFDPAIMKSYISSKAIADSHVLAANQPTGPSKGKLLTGCVRIGPTYGEGDSKNITWQGIEIAKQGQTFIQLGGNTSLYDPTYVGNAVDLHILLAKALVREPAGNKYKVDGEAFNVTDDSPMPFWDFFRGFFSATGVHQRPDRVLKIPTWVVFVLAWLTEWIFWIVFRGQRRPQRLMVFKIEFLTRTRTWSVEKAKERLGWRPRFTTDEGTRRGAAWALKKWDEEGETKRKRKGKVN